MKGSPMHRNYGIGSPAKQTRFPDSPGAKKRKTNKIMEEGKENFTFHLKEALKKRSENKILSDMDKEVIKRGTKGVSPAKNKGKHEHDSKGKHKTTETRGRSSITKTKGDKSSTYNKTKSTKNKDGSVTEVYTNDLGNTETRNVSKAK